MKLQVRKLAEMATALRDKTSTYFSITRLTSLKSLCKEPTTAAQQSTSDPRPGKAPSGSVSGLIVTLFEPTGYLLRIEHEGGSITLDRAETWALYLELQNKIGAMPFKL